MTEHAAQLMAEKITRELFRLSQAYGQPLPCGFDDLLRDFTLMITHEDLETVRLLFADKQHRTLLEYAYHIRNGQMRRSAPHDVVGGLAVVPLAEPFTLNVVISRKGQAHTYAAQLRIQWGDAPTYTRTGGDQCDNPHFSRKTGGRAGNEIYADRHLRKSGRVKFFSAEKQYGFIVPDETGAPEVFFHASVTTGLLRTGERVSYLPLVTPRGIQARVVIREG